MTYNPVQKAYELVNDYLEYESYAEVDLEKVRGYLGEALDDQADSGFENTGRNSLEGVSVYEIREGLQAMAAEPDTTIVFTNPEPTIKDSGDRTQFASGAVRDMRAGKGRCDLMPLEVVANYICEDNGSTDTVLWGLSEFLQTNSTVYLYSALSTFETLAYNDPCTMFLEVAKHYEEGALKYGESNWQKGIPTWCYIDSAARHYLKWRRGDKDEPHDRAFVWNVLCCIWEVDYRK